MGIVSGHLILESGHESDCDESIRNSIIKISGNDLLSGEIHEVVDSVILWWREDDGDLIDELVDALTYLVENGSLWLLTPKAGREGHVEPSDIQDAAPIAGLSVTSSFPVASDWTATKLLARKSTKK
ncbi:MAG: DUF3052 family protein [Acidobacteria bacterium]|nr:DUF3052 family protein [Acidobacteriota bacterium]